MYKNLLQTQIAVEFEKIAAGEGRGDLPLLRIRDKTNNKAK